MKWITPMIVCPAIAALALTIPAVPVSAKEKLVAASGDKQTTLLELFTSEGCSSCPPAEAWLSDLAKDPGLWKAFVPVVFHVDYWDYLGWKDRFASSVFTRRQSAYAAAWRSRQVYTPGFVLNGHEWRWSPRQLTPPTSDAPAGALSLWRDNDRMIVRYKPVSSVTADWEAHLAILANGLEVAVTRGENAHKTLRHDFVALVLEHKIMRQMAGSAVTEFALPQPPPIIGTKHAIAAWVTSAGKLTPAQATGNWWP